MESWDQRSWRSSWQWSRHRRWPRNPRRQRTRGALGGQSLESAANDATASMWTFQLSLEGRTWKDEDGPNGEPRPEGNRDQLMLRFVAPVPLGKNLKVINRFTMRNNEAVDKSSGAGDAEYFALFVPFEWATGRWGIGPQVNFPAESSKFGSDKWRYGFASAWLERVGDKVMTGVLVQQIWGKTDPNDPDRQVAQPDHHPAGLQLLAQERLLPQHRRDRLQLQLGRQRLADSARCSLRQGLYQRERVGLEPLWRDPKDRVSQQ